MPSATDREPFVLYDADCGFCLACVEWVRTRTRSSWRFVPLGSPQGSALLAGCRIPSVIDSVVVVVGGNARTKSDAVLAMLADCPMPWRLAACGVILPRPWRDGLYDLVARHRHRLSSKGCKLA